MTLDPKVWSKAKQSKANNRRRRKESWKRKRKRKSLIYHTHTLLTEFSSPPIPQSLKSSNQASKQACERGVFFLFWSIRCNNQGIGDSPHHPRKEKCIYLLIIPLPKRLLLSCQFFAFHYRSFLSFPSFLYNSCTINMGVFCCCCCCCCWNLRAYDQLKWNGKGKARLTQSLSQSISIYRFEWNDWLIDGPTNSFSCRESTLAFLFLYE